MEKFSMTMGSAPSMVSTTSSLLIPSHRLSKFSRLQFSIFLAFETFDMPGSLPTTRTSVLPLTDPVTRPPKLSIMDLTLSLPRLSPPPPPTSGKIPVNTHVFPAMHPGFARPTPGLGSTNLAFAGEAWASSSAPGSSFERASTRAAEGDAGASAGFGILPDSEDGGVLVSALGSVLGAILAGDFLGVDGEGPVPANVALPRPYWAQFPLSITWVTISALCASSSSFSPQNSTSFRLSSLFRNTSGLVASTLPSWGMASQIFLGTRQHAKWHHLVYPKVWSSLIPSRSIPFLIRVYAWVMERHEVRSEDETRRDVRGETYHLILEVT